MNVDHYLIVIYTIDWRFCDCVKSQLIRTILINHIVYEHYLCIVIYVTESNSNQH